MIRLFCAAMLACMMVVCPAQAEIEKIPLEAKGGTPPVEACFLSDTVYEDESMRVEIEEHQVDATRCVVARVKIADPSQLRSAPAFSFTRQQTEMTKKIARKVNAVLAINGDYYNYKDNVGLVIRNGELYRDKATTRDQLLVYADGTFKALPRGSYEQGTGQQYIDEGVVQCFTFGPLLVNDGEAVELPKKYIISTKDTIREPRTAIGQIDANHYVVIVADGRRDGWSDLGMTLQELQQMFVQLGCTVAYNMDGGGSATMILDGERVNKTSGSRERDVSDIIYFTR